MNNRGKVVGYKERISNYELLRIVAMILVMLGHSHVRLQSLALDGAGTKGFFDTAFACVSTLGVGIFITISGWFGIRFKTRGLIQYIFQVLFILWIIYGLSIIFRSTNFNVEGIIISMGFYEGYWFIIGYLGLYLMSPILNAFIDSAAKKEYQLVLFLLLTFQCCYSWLSEWYNYYNGYSIVLFSVIYLTTAYIRKYPIEWVERNAPWLFLFVIMILAFIATFSLWKFGHAARMVRDDNPMVILACVLLLLSFKKLKFHSKMVNWLAASCFSVYLIHYSPYVFPIFISVIKEVYSQYSGIIYCVMLLLFMFSTYLCCTIIDQLRIFAWQWIYSLINKEK